MITTEQKQIGEWHYETTQLGSKDGRRLLVRLYKLLGPAAAEFLAGLEDKDGGKGGAQIRNLGDVKTDAIADAVTELAARITEDELDHVVDTLAKKTRVSQNGTSGWQPLVEQSEMIWAGNYTEMFKWLAFALGVNYSGFTGGLGNLSAFVSQAAQGSQSKSPNQSTGTPTG